MSKTAKVTSSELPVAARLTSLRSTEGLSLEELAERSGLTKSYLSKLERGLSEPSISSISRLAEAFGITVSEFVGDKVPDKSFRVLRQQSRRALPSASGMPVFELLHGDSVSQGARLSVYLQHPELLSESESSACPYATHSGEEFIYVLNGKVQLRVADKMEELNPGDGAWYNSEFTHKLNSIGKRRADVVVVTCSCGNELKRR